MFTKATLLAALLTVAGAPAFAQGTQLAIAGTVEALDAATLTLKNAETGAIERFALAPNLLVLESKPATLADIKPNDFIASAAMRGTDGKLHSTELRIFPEALRGAGEGQRPMADASRTMTNATVTGAAIANGSNTIAVKFGAGTSELVVDPGIPVTRIESADRTLLHAGSKVRIQGQRSADGATASRITLQ